MREKGVCNENTTLCKKCPFFAQPADDEYGGDYEDGDHEKERALHLDCAQLVDDEDDKDDEDGDYEEELHLDGAQLVGQLAHACLQL